MYIILSISDWTSFFGRFHPLFVHLPIGFLVLIAIMEFLKFTKKLTVDDTLLKIVLLLTAISATFSCFAGYFLSLEGGYNEEILDEHKWQGIWLAVFTWIAWFAKNAKLNEEFNIQKFVYFPALIFSMLLMFVAGHHGGNLTHGETYLTENTPQPFRNWFGIPEKNDKTESSKKVIANINEALVYQEIIHPIFKEKCEKCHNASKMKGDLRMDEVALFQKGGKNGVIFKANNVEESEFIKRILLPESDEHHMPPKGKNQISENEITLMKWWVEQGASFDKKISQLTVNKSIKSILVNYGGGMGTSSNSIVKQDKFDIEEELLSKEVNAIDDDFITEIKNTGGLVLPLGQNTNYVEITFLNNSKFSDKEANMLSKSPKQTLWLKLNNTQITDKTLEEVSKLTNLTRLHIENTKISDAGMTQLSKLENLEYLNLNGTNLTDAGLKNLSSLKNLKKIYLWQTKITPNGMEDLKKSLPNLNINLGISQKQITTLLSAKADTISDDVYKKK